jgi:WD40 repeat protein
VLQPTGIWAAAGLSPSTDEIALGRPGEIQIVRMSDAASEVTDRFPAPHVRAVAFLTSSTLAFADGIDRTLSVWRRGDTQPITTFTLASATLAFSADGSRAAAIAGDSTTVYELSRGHVVATIAHPDADRVALSADGEALAVWNFGGRWLEVRSIPDGALRRRFESETLLKCAEFSPTRDLVAAGGDGVVLLVPFRR